MEDKRFKRYKLMVWAFIIVTLAAYVNGIWDIIKFFVN